MSHASTAEICLTHQGALVIGLLTLVAGQDRLEQNKKSKASCSTGGKKKFSSNHLSSLFVLINVVSGLFHTWACKNIYFGASGYCLANLKRPKLRFYPFTTYHHVDGGSGDVS